MAVLRAILAALALGPTPSAAGPGTSAPPLAALTIAGAPEVVFSRRRDGCDGYDVPDAPARAFRDGGGEVVVFATHFRNRALRGPDLGRLVRDCRVVLASGRRSDPAAYDDKSWIAATWTEDGKTVHALIHHEFQADAHPGRCRFRNYLACWYNSVLSLTSRDGASSFPRPQTPRVVAGAPFRQEVGQGRHRGFFNPSNIVSDGSRRYVFAATTGWAGQPHGACLFRTDDPADPASWRAYDGRAFTIRYGDPYRDEIEAPRPCRPVEPFPGPVGAIVRHRPTGAWIAVFQAKGDDALFPEPGFYYAASRDLLAWDRPRLLLPGKTLYDDPCAAGGRLIAYPSLLDRAATSRNFEDVGDTAELYFVTLAVEGCAVTSERDLVRRKVAITVWP